ncbi:MAG: hypothetical protein ACLTK0_10770 [Anaerovoracaceae bacterium]
MRVLNGGNFNISLNTSWLLQRRTFPQSYGTLDYDAVNNDIYVGSIKPTGPIISGMASALSEDENCTSTISTKLRRTEAVPYYDQLTSGEMKVTSPTVQRRRAAEKMALLMQAGMSQLGVTVEITANLSPP